MGGAACVITGGTVLVLAGAGMVTMGLGGA